jgi:hypothetical protein
VSQTTDCCNLKAQAGNLSSTAPREKYHNIRNLATPKISLFILVNILVSNFTVSESITRQISERNQEILMADYLVEVF